MQRVEQRTTITEAELMTIITQLTGDLKQLQAAGSLRSKFEYKRKLNVIAEWLKVISRRAFLQLDNLDYYKDDENTPKPVSHQNYVTLSNNLTNAILLDILASDQIEACARAFERWAAIMHRCLKHHDYFTCLTINGALSERNLSQLRLTKAHVSRKTTELIDTINEMQLSDPKYALIKYYDLHIRKKDYLPVFASYLGAMAKLSESKNHAQIHDLKLQIEETQRRNRKLIGTPDGQIDAVYTLLLKTNIDETIIEKRGMHCRVMELCALLDIHAKKYQQYALTAVDPRNQEKRIKRKSAMEVASQIVLLRVTLRSMLIENGSLADVVLHIDRLTKECNEIKERVMKNKIMEDPRAEMCKLAIMLMDTHALFDTIKNFCFVNQPVEMARSYPLPPPMVVNQDARVKKKRAIASSDSTGSIKGLLDDLIIKKGVVVPKPEVSVASQMSATLRPLSTRVTAEQSERLWKPLEMRERGPKRAGDYLSTPAKMPNS